MKIASLQLELFFVTDLHLTANKEFDRSKPAQMKYENLVVETDCTSKEDDGRKWQVTLRVKHQGGADLNTPYAFSTEVVGFFTVSKGYPGEKVANLVRTNGPSMLLGATREIVRDMTARGPCPPVFLPAVSFYQGTAKPTAQAQTSMETPKKVPEAAS